jgi:sarcosine dehydrogenase
VIDSKSFNVTLTDDSDKLAMISVQGPYSKALLQAIAADPSAFENDKFPFSTCRDVVVADKQSRCLRLTFVGEMGWELHVPVESAVHVYQALMKEGAQLSQEHGVPILNSGYRAIDSMSAEKGYRHWHADLSNQDTPFEAGIGFTAIAKLKNTNTPFLGREVLAKQMEEGVKRRLICLTVDDSTVPLHGRETIWRNGECIGYVKSTAFGHTVGKSIAFGYVSHPEGSVITSKWLVDGRFEVEAMLKRHAATFHAKAVFDASNSRVKGDYSPNA